MRDFTPSQLKEHLTWLYRQPKYYKEICSLCKGNGYITIVVKDKDEIKQCWLCESKGEKKCDTNTQ